MSDGTISGHIYVSSGYSHFGTHTMHFPPQGGNGLLRLTDGGVSYEVRRLLKSEAGFLAFSSLRQVIVGNSIYLFGRAEYRDESSSALTNSSGTYIDLVPSGKRDLRTFADELFRALGQPPYTSHWWARTKSARNSPYWCQYEDCESDSRVSPEGLMHDCFVYRVECDNYQDHGTLIRVPVHDSELAGIWASQKDPRWVTSDDLEDAASHRGDQLGVHWFGTLDRGHFEGDVLYAIPNGFKAGVGSHWDGIGCIMQVESPPEAMIEVWQRPAVPREIFDPRDEDKNFGYVRLLAGLPLTKSIEAGPSYVFEKGLLIWEPIDRQGLMKQVDSSDFERLELRLIVEDEWAGTYHIY